MIGKIWIGAIGVALVTAGVAAGAAAPASRGAVLVELFTSEGCSSCPPADALLEALQSAETIVLSEHVDYWNHIGWKDPYSSQRYSQRQQTYANRLHLDGVYTPQMVVDGTAEFVGSDERRAKTAIAQAAHFEKAAIRLTPAADGKGQSSRVRVEVDALPASLKAGDAEVYLAVAANEETSQVLRGENGGRRLHHVAVVRSLTSIGKIRQGEVFHGEGSLGAPGEGRRIVAFVQERGQGRVLGAAMLALR